MGRKPKKGIDYFPADVEMFQDRKIKRLLRSAGGKGFTIYIYLLTHIYREHGYFYEWDEHSAFDISDDLNFSENVVEEAVKACCARGLFNEELYAAESVLTSESIQERWQKIVTDANRVDTHIEDRYRIVDGEPVFLRGKTKFPPKETEKPPEETPQSKVNQSKVNTPPPRGRPREEPKDDGPQHKPDSLDAVKQFFSQNQASEAIAEDFYDHYASQGWVKSNGMAITSWQSAASKWIREEKHNPPGWKQKSKRKGGKNGTDRKSKGDEHVEALQSFYS